MITRLKTLLACAVAVSLLAGCGGKEERKAKYLERGKTFFEEENYDKARIEFKNVLQIDPKAAEAYYYIGAVAEKEKEWSKSFGAFSKAVELDPTLIDARAKLGQFYLLQAGASRAGEHFDGEREALAKATSQAAEILKLDPGNLDAEILEASLDVHAGLDDKAIQSLSSIIEKHPGKENAVIFLARLLEGKEQIADAQQILENGIKAQPKSLGIRGQLVELHARQKNYEAVTTQMRELISIKPDEFKYRVALATYFVQEKNIDQAEAVLRDAIMVAPEEPDRYLVLAEFLAAQKGMDIAIAELESASNNNADMHELRFGLAKLLYRNGSVDKAKQVLNKIVERERTEPKGLTARVRLAELYGAESNFDEVRRLIAEVLTENPNDAEAMLIKGRLDLKDDKLSDAISAFRSVLKGQPDSAEVLQLLAQAHLKNGETELAGDQLRRAVEVAPNDIEARLTYARYLLAKNDHTNAAKQVDAALNADPANVNALSTQSDILFAKKDTSGVKEVLEKLKLAAPESPEGNVRLAKVLYEEKDFDGALREADAALGKDENNFNALVAKSNVLAAKNERKALREVLQTMQTVYPDLPEGYFRMGRLYRVEKEYEKALEEYDKALDRATGAGEVQMLTEIVNTQVGMGKSAVAEKRLKSILAENPKHTIANDLLGVVYMGDKRFAEAEEAFIAQIAINPKSNTVYIQLASARGAQKDLEGAASAYEQGLKAIPGDLRLLMGHAGVQELQGNFPLAMELYQRVLDKAPDNILATNNLASLLADKGTGAADMEKAKSLAVRLSVMSQPAFQDTVGWVYYKSGDLVKAAKVLKAVVEKVPEIGVFNYHLGMVLHKQGDSSGAKTYLTKAVELGQFREVDEARKVLQELQ